MADAIPSITKLDDAAALWGLREDVKKARSRLEIQWKLGMAFYRGRQYTYYSTSLKRIQQLPTSDTKPRGKTRVISNQIKPNCNKLVAKLTKTKAQFTATSGNGDPDSMKAARLCEAAADYWWTAFDLQQKYRQAITWARICGQGYWLITWDQYAGQPFQYLVDPATQEPVPAEHQDLFRQELANEHPAAMQAATRTSYEGDMHVEVLSPLNTWLDTSVEQFEDIRYFGVDRHLDPAEVKTRWGQDLKADSVITEADLGAQVSEYDNAKKSVVVVSTLYIRPCPTVPAGRVVVFTKDKILEDNTWNFPFKYLPLMKFGATPIPNSVYDTGEVEDAIPLNKELNKTLSQALTHRDLTINPKWTVPRSNVQQFDPDDPIQQYSPINGQKPEQVMPPPMPAYIKDIIQDMNMRIKECFGLNDVSSGVAPPGMESGIAMDLAQEASDEVIAPIVIANENSLGKALQCLLEYARVNYQNERLLTITGSNGRGQIQAFRGSSIPEHVSIHTEASSSMPRTRSGALARVMLLQKSGLIPPGQEYKYLDMPDLKGWKQAAMVDEDHAEREHDKIKAGIPLNPIALAEAQGQMQSMPGINPKTQLPWQSPQEAQAFLLEAMLAPTSYENYDVHYARHTNYMKSVEYEALDDNLKHEFEVHTQATLQRIMDIAQATKERQGNVKVNLAAHEVLGPQAVDAILREAGVQGLNPAILATEEPMESMVMTTDSLDKPNADGSTPPPTKSPTVAKVTPKPKAGKKGGSAK